VTLFLTHPSTATVTTEYPEVLDGATRKRYDKARSVFKRKLLSAAEQTVKAEKLSHKDFAIRINAR